MSANPQPERICLPKPAAQARTKTGERIAHQLADWIAEGRLRPGDRLPTEPDLIAHFGVARGSVREALRLLENAGVVRPVVGRGGGMLVNDAGTAAFASTSTLYLQLQGATYGDVIDARLLMEPALAEAAASRRTQADLDRLTSHLTRIEGPHEIVDLVDPVVRFHVDLAQASGNAALSLFVGACAVVFARRLAAHLTDLGDTTSAASNTASLRKVLAAVQAGDHAESRKRMEGHLRLVRDNAARVGGVLDTLVTWQR